MQFGRDAADFLSRNSVRSGAKNRIFPPSPGGAGILLKASRRPVR
jgi:hypothetical protein